MPLPPKPAYGDAARLEQLASGLKRTNGTYGPLVQRTPAGRPAGTAGTPAPRAASAPQGIIRPEHKSAADEVRDAEIVRQQWRAIAEQSPTPAVLAMLDMAERDFQAAATKFYNVSPNVEY